MLLDSILHFDLSAFVETVGYVGVFAIVFAESGLFFGFFLPGGSLLVVTGLLASQGVFNIWIVIVLLAAAAILGDNVGYWFGMKVGPKIFTREDSFFFHKKHVQKTKQFYEKYGTRVILIARFVPIVRTFAPILAGVAGMRYRLFFIYNVIGAVVWGIGGALIGYFLGNTIPNIEKYTLYIVVGIVVVSCAPLFFEFIRPVQKR